MYQSSRKRRYNKYSNKKKSTTKKLNSLAYKVAQIKPEVKEVYNSRAFAASTADNTFTTLNGMKKGADNGLRQGNKVKLKSFTFNFLAELGDPQILTGTDATQAVWSLEGAVAAMRVIIYCDTQNNNSTTNTINEILRFGGSQIVQTTSVYNSDFVGYKKKYKILYDKYFCLSNLSGNNFASLRVSKRLSYNVNFGDTDLGTAADIIDNDIRVLIVSPTTDIVYQWFSRIRYTDV